MTTEMNLHIPTKCPLHVEYYEYSSSESAETLIWIQWRVCLGEMMNIQLS